MTREQFRAARIEAADYYRVCALVDYRKAKTDLQKENAKRRYNLAYSMLEEYKANFWNSKNESSYSMIYSNIDDVSAVSAF